MPKSNLPVPGLFGSAIARQDRRTASAVSTIHAEMFVERARDAAQRDLTILKMADIGQAGRYGIAEAGDIAACVTAQIEANPVSANAVTQLGETTVRGLERELRRLTKEG